MLTFAIVIYVYMCWISQWDILWPITMVQKGGLGDYLIVAVWAIILIAGLSH